MTAKDITLEINLNNITNPQYDGGSVIVAIPLEIDMQDLLRTGRKVPVLKTPLDIIPLRVAEYGLRHNPNANQFSIGKYCMNTDGQNAQLLVPVQFYKSVEYKTGQPTAGQSGL